MRARRAGSAASWASRSARLSGSRGGTRKPVLPCTTVLRMPPVSEPTTGRPQAMASTGVMPKGSYHGVVTNTSQAP
ncbi:Uncharacterised protein [Achromobacter xylosoxidans]|nr:Uncharacterised protein [Achromobacter xylosoxidans]